MKRPEGNQVPAARSVAAALILASMAPPGGAEPPLICHSEDGILTSHELPRLDVAGDRGTDDRIELLYLPDDPEPVVARIHPEGGDRSFLVSVTALAVRPVRVTCGLPATDVSFQSQSLIDSLKGLGLESLNGHTYKVDMSSWNQGPQCIPQGLESVLSPEESRVARMAPALAAASLLRRYSEGFSFGQPGSGSLVIPTLTPFLDVVVTLDEIPANEGDATHEWHLRLIGADCDDLKELQIPKPAKVAVVDSGVCAHDAFEGVRSNDSVNLVEPTPNGSLSSPARERPCDEYGHGTKVAGAIAAKDQGVAPGASLISIQVFDKKGCGYLTTITEGVRRSCEERGVVLLAWHIQGDSSWTCSTTDSKRNHPLCEAIRESPECLFVAAAGDKEGDVDEDQIYPAAWGGVLDNLVVVGGVEKRGTWISNWGENSVHLAAPGEDCYTTLAGDDFGYEGGTSMAAAYVAGAASLYLGMDPRRTAKQAKDALIASARARKSGAYRKCCRDDCGILDVCKLLTGQPADVRRGNLDGGSCTQR